MSSISNAQRVRRAFARAQNSYDKAAFLQREVCARLLERLDEISLTPARIADLGAGTGNATFALRKRCPKSHITAVDFAQPMLRQLLRKSGLWRKPSVVCADVGSLPFASASFDLLFSSLTFQWCDNLPGVFAEQRRVLAPHGALLFATLGPSTLQELRTAWAAVDTVAHVNEFVDMHDIGDALMRAGFRNPVVDVERIVLTYPSAMALLRELKALGANRVTVDGRGAGLTGKGRIAAMQSAYAGLRDNDGRYPATFEIVFGLAWQADETPRETVSVLRYTPQR